MTEYEESNLSRSLPTRFVHDCFKILEWKWFNSRSCVGAVLVWDLVEKRLKCFLSSPKYNSTEEDQVREIVDFGCTLPSEMTIVIFKKYLQREDVFNNLDNNLKLFMSFTELLNKDSK